MDAAYLHHSLINIEEKRKELEEHLNREETLNLLEDKYRSLSKKGAFTCVCCNQPVNMNLTKDAGRPFYFKHIDESECAFSENTRTYQQHIKKTENLPKKELGIAVFREILEGELKPFKAVVERGYHYKSKLKFVPDFIVSFPELKNKWAIDYFTAMDRKVVSGHYARQLAGRMDTYQQEGFKAYAFVDSDWLAFKDETRMGTLFNSEVEVASKGYEDHLWDRFLNQRLHGALLTFFKQSIGANTIKFDTKSIAYVDLNDRSCKVIRWIPVSRSYRNLTFYQLTSSQVSLSRALSMNAKHTDLQLSALNEDNKRASFLAELTEKKAERDRAIDRQKEEKEMLPRTNKVITSAPQAMSQTQPVNVDITDEEVERRMRERAKIASMRPIQFSAEQWERIQKRGGWQPNQRIGKDPEQNVAPLEDPMKTRNRKKALEILLSTSVPGETFIDSGQEEWRKVIIAWAKDNRNGNNIDVELPELIAHMKEEGIIFNQSDQLIQHPIKEFLRLYEKTVSSVIKDKIKVYVQ